MIRRDIDSISASEELWCPRCLQVTGLIGGYAPGPYPHSPNYPTLDAECCGTPAEDLCELPTARTPEEIEEAKGWWLDDPSLNIEDFEDFELHREELKAWRLAAQCGACSEPLSDGEKAICRSCHSAEVNA